MKRGLLAASAAAILITAAIATPVSAQGSVRSGGGAPAASSHAGGGGGGGGRSIGGGGSFRGGGGGGAQFHGGGGNASMQFSNRGNTRTHVGPQFHCTANAQFGKHDGRFAHRRHFRGPVIGFGGPFYYDYGYDYGAPVYSDDDDCYQIRRVRTEYGWRNVRVYVCGNDD